MRSTWVTANDYEGKMLSEGTGWSYADISRRVRGPVVTLGADDSEVWVGAEKKHIPSVTPMATPNCSTYGHPNCPRQDG